jgi:transaldolase
MRDPAAAGIQGCGPDTINTIPDKTLLAFADHGTLGDSMSPDGGDFEQVIAQPKKAGIDNAAFEKLQHDGAAACVKSWKNLLACMDRNSLALAMSART